MISKVSIGDFIQGVQNSVVLDVRSPSEFKHAHIPGAISLPLFSDTERALIGAAYKQESREKAIRIGLDSFGRNMVAMVDDVEKIFKSKKEESREVFLHCWRGGMRSAAVAWLLDLYGFKVYLLAGGYKAYRNWVLDQFKKPYNLLIVGGYTGSSKTYLLHQLRQKGENVIDLEQLAGHRGSAFGNLDMHPQPGQEHFENMLAMELFTVSKFQNKGPIWVEGESQRIGTVNIPQDFFTTMRNNSLLFLEIPFEQRLKQIIKDYGKYDKNKIINAIVRIKKRLGGLETKNAINALLEEDIEGCFRPLLKYYDKLYIKSTLNPAENPRDITYVPAETTDVKINFEKLMEYAGTRK